MVTGAASGPERDLGVDGLRGPGRIHAGGSALERNDAGGVVGGARLRAAARTRLRLPLAAADR